MRIERREIFKNKAFLIVVSALLAFTNCRIAAFAGDLPADPLIKAGNPAITSDGTNMTVNAGTATKTYIDWQGGFNIGAANSVNNIAAEASSVILHHDVSGALSNIQGALNGNCNVFVLNPSGILFGAGASVNVAGLVVSTLNLSVSDFLNGNYVLDQGSNASGIITNAGTITATGPMGVTLAGGAVRNEGVINAGIGTVNLAGGSQVTLNADSEGLIQVTVNGKVLDNVYDKDGNRVTIGVDNVGEINANGGKVYIEAEAAKDVFDTLINQEGVVKAGSMVNKGGKIVLVSNSEGIVENSGTLDVSGVEDGTSGGTIEMRGEKVGQFGTVKADGFGDSNGGDITLYARDTVALSSGSLTAANAGNNGNGGTITVYSPDTALFRNGAKIEAKGGSISGDGGFVEVSGKEYFEICGLVDTRAANGLTGTFLIDPYNVTISSAADANPDSWTGTPYSPAGSGANINVSTLQTQLGSTNVEVTTGASGGEEGDITVSNALSWNSAYSLTLTAADDIAINAPITNTGSGGLTLTAVDRIDVDANVTLNGGSFTATTTTATTGTIDVGVGTTVNVGSGNMTLTSDVLWLQTTPAEFAGTGALTLQPYTSSSSIGLAGAAGTWGLTQDHLTGFMNGGFSSLTIGKSGGTHAITVNALTLADPFTLRGGSVTIDGALATTGALTFTSSGAVDINNTVTTNGGAFNSSGTSFDNTGGTITTGAGAITINQTGAITIGANISTNNYIDIDTTSTFGVNAGSRIIVSNDAGNGLSITASSITLGAGSNGSETLTTNSGPGADNAQVTLNATGGNIVLGDSSIRGGDALVSLTATGTINGSVANDVIDIDTEGNVTLSANGIGDSVQVELGGDGTRDNTLTITNTGAGNVDIQEVTNQFNVVTITQNNASSNINVDFATADLIDITGGTPVAISNAILNNGNVAFNYTLSAAADLSITAVTGGTGNVNITASNGALTVTAAGGGITTTGSGDITLSSSGIMTINDSLSAGDAISLSVTSSDTNLNIADTVTAGGTLTLRSDDMSIAAVTTGANIYIYTKDADTVISLGTDTATANQLDLTAAELQSLASTGTVTIGQNGTNTAAINIGGAVNLSSETFGVTLATEGKIDATGAGLTLTLADEEILTLDAGTSIGATNAVTTAATVINADAGTGSLTLTNTGNVTDLQLNANSGTITFNNTGSINTGAAITADVINLTSSGVMTINQDVTADAGAVTLTSTADDAGSNTFVQTFGTISSTAGITITADDMSLGSAITSAGQIVTLKSNTSGDAINLGTNGSVAGTLELTDAELNTITATTLTIGTTVAGAITLSNNVTPGSVTNLTLINGSTISDSGAYTLGTSGTLTLDSDDGISGSYSGTNVGSALRISAGTLAARTRTSGNIAITEADALTIGSAVNGSSAFNGVSTVANGNIALENAGGTLTIDQGVAANGSGTVNIDATGQTITQNSNDVGTISSTSGDITIRVGGTGGTPTAKPFYIAKVVTNQLNTVGDVYLYYGGNVIDNNAGQLNIQAHTLNLSDTSTGTVAVFGAGGDEIELNVNSIGDVTTGSFDFTNTGDISLGSITTTAGGFSVNALTGTVTFNGNIAVYANNNLSMTADDIIIASGKTLSVSGTGTIHLQPFSPDRAIYINPDTITPPVGFNLSEAEMQSLVTASGRTVTIGREGGTGAITIGNDTAGAVDLSGTSYDLTLNGGTATIEQEITLRNGGTFDLNLTGALIDSNGGTPGDSDIIFGLIGSTGQTGTLNITSVGGVGTAGDPLEVQVGDGSTTGNMLTLSVDNGNVDTSTSGILITTTGPTTLNGITNNDQGNITIIAGSPLTIDADVIATDNGNISLSNTGAGDITINENVEIKAELGDISINSSNNIVVELNGTGILIQTGGDGEIDLTANATTGDITLGDGTAGSNLLINQTGTGTVDINAGDDIALARIVTAGGPVTVDASGSADADVIFYGAVNSSSVNLGAVSSSGSLTVNARNITVNGALESTASLVDINSTGTLDVNSAISAFTTLALDSDTSAMILSGISLTAKGNVSINDAVTLDTGAVTVSSTTGNVTFSSTIDGAQNLTVNADNGTVTFGGISGGTSGIGALAVTAGVLIDVNAAITDADSVTFYGNSDIGGDITATAGAITLNGSNNTISGGARTLTASTYIDVNGDISGAQNLTLAGTNNVMIRSIGLGADPTLLDINTTALQLEGDITVDGNVRFNGAVTTTLAADVTIDTTGGGNGTIVDFAALNGNHALTIAGGDADISFAGVTQLTGLTVSSSDTMDFSGVVSMPGSINVTAAESDNDSIDMQSTIDSTAGSVTFNGKFYFWGGSVNAGEDITVNGITTVAGGSKIMTADNGSINLNGALNDSSANTNSISLNAANGTIYVQGIGATTAVNVLDINSVEAEFFGNLKATAVDITGVGLSRLTNDITITASGAAGILLGDLTGAKALTLVASNGSGVITLLDANIGSLSITDADAVNFNGNFVTSGAVTVGTSITNNISVASTGSIQAGGNISLDNTAGAGTVDIVLNGNVSTTGSSSITISADDAVTIAQTAAASVTAVDGEIDITTSGTLTLGTGAIAGQIVTTGTGLIDINNTGALTMGTASGNKISGGGGVDINGASSISGEVMATNAGNVLFTGAVTLVGNSTVGSDNGNVTFNSTVGGAYSLTANAPAGIVKFNSTVGTATDQLTALTVNANEAQLYGNISTDGGTNADIDFRGTDLVTLAANLTLDTENGGDAVGGDVLFGTASRIVGDYDLTIDTTGTSNGTLQVNDADVDQFTVTGVSTATLYGRIESDDTISLNGAATVTLADTVTLVTTTGNVTIDNTMLNGQHPLTVVSAGTATFDAITQLTGLTITATSIDFTDAVSMPGDISATVSVVTADAIDVQAGATIDSTDGSVTFTATGGGISGTTLNADLSAGQSITINGPTTLSTGARTLTADNGSIDINAAIDSEAGQNRDLTLTADNGTVYVQGLGTTQRLGALDINADYAQLNGNIQVKSVDTTGVGLTTLTAGTVDIDTTGFTTINLGALNGANNLTISAGTTVTLADADIASLTIDAGTGVTFNGDFVTSGAVSVTGISGTTTITDATGSIQAGGAVTLSAGTVTNNELISGNSVSITGSSVINLNGNVNSNNGLTIFNNAVTLTGNSIASSTNGNVTFSGDVSGGYTLEADAPHGTVTFSSTIGNTTDPTALTVNADNLTLTGAVNVAGNIDVNANSVTFATGSGTIATTASNGNIDFATALMDANTGAAIDLALTTNGSGNVVLGTIGSSDPVASLAVTSSGTTTLNGNITVDNGNITLTNATDVNLAANVTLTATGNILLNGGAVDGGYALSVYSTGNITVDAIGQNVPLTSLTLSAGGAITISDSISVDGPVLIETAGGSGDNITVGGNVIGSSVTFDARSAGIVTVNVAQNNTLGSTTFNGLVTLNNSITALDDITFSTYGVTLATNVSITSTGGDIDLNGAVDSSSGNTYDFTLTADSGSVFAQSIGTSVSVSILDINSDYAQLNGNIQAVSVDTTGVGLTTLTNDISINASGSSGILLGDLSGSRDLTLTASNSSGVITLLDANIGSLTINDAFSVDFNGNFAVNGAVSVTGVENYIKVASSGSIQAGGAVTLNALGSVNSYVDNYGVITAGANIDIQANDYVGVDADITTVGIGTIYINADADNVDSGTYEAFYIGYTGEASITSENGDITIIGGNVYVGYNEDGQVVTTGTGNINIDLSSSAAGVGTIDIYTENVESGINAGGSVNIGQNNAPDSLTMENSFIRAQGTITTDSETFNMDSGSNVTSYAGDIDIGTSNGDMTVEGNITAIGHTVTLNSNGYIYDTSDDNTYINARTVDLTAVSGIGSGTDDDALDTEVDYIKASVTGTGDIYILEQNGVTLTNVTTNNGLIDIVTGNVSTGDTVVTSVTSGGNQNVDITAELGDIYLASVSAANATATITASNGSIYDDDINSTKITADTVDLNAAGNIGLSGTDRDIDTACATLNADTTGPGDIYVTDDDAVTLNSVTTNLGSITVKGARTADGNMVVSTVTAGGDNADVTLQTLAGAGGNNSIVLNGVITASADDVTLNSDYNITDSTATAVDIVSSGLYLAAGNNVGANGTEIDTNVSTIDDVSTGVNVTGAIYIYEYDGVDLGPVNGLTTDTGDINVTSNRTAAGTLTASSVTAGGSGDIYLTSGNSSDIALGYVNALGDDVTLVSANNITDEDTDSAIDIVADRLYLQAAGYCGTSGTDAGIDTDVAYIDNVVSNVVAGAIYINENDGVTLGSTNGLTSTNGPIYITAANNADGTLVAGSVTISTDNANGITLVTNAGNGGLNDIQLGAVTAGTSSAVITLVSDNDILDSDGAVDITAYGLLLEANGSIGTSSDYVDTSVSTIDDRSASANVRNNIYINETDGVNLGAVNGLTTDIGDVYVTAGGTLTASSVAAGDDGNIYLTTSVGNIVAGLITALGDDVYLNAAGSITDGDTTVDILADRLYLTAGGDVGATGDYLDTKVNNIDDYSATENVAGNIYISEYDGVNLGALISTGLTTDNGSIFVASNATEDGTLTATLVTAGGSGNITLTSQVGASSTGNVNDIAVGLVTAAGDDVTLNSNDDITDLVPDEVTDIVADGLYLAANGTIGGKGSGLELDTRVSTIDDISGSNVYETVYIIEYDGVSLGSINGLTTDTGDIDITAANNAAGDMDAVSVTASGEGNILLTTLDGGTGANSINVGLITAEGDDVSLVSDADITDSDTTGLDIVSDTLRLRTNGAVGTSANYLDTRVANIDDYTGGNIGTDLYISEYDGVILGALNSTTGLSTANGEIRVVAAVTAAGNLTAQTLTAGGTGKDIYLTTDNGGNGNNNIGLGVVTASGDDIYLNSDWSITDSDLDLTADVISSGLYFTAQGSFGGSGNPARIETTVDTIDDYSLGVNTAANIYISETDAVTLGSIFGLTTDAGVIDIVAGGTITTGTLAANGGFGIFLNSTSGDLLDLEGGSFTATAKSELRTGGIIGTIENPYNVNVTAGGLWVWAGSQDREVSANLRGTVVSSADTERVEIFEPSPPGLVILNNHLMGGGNYGSGSANGSILSRGYGYIDIVRNDLIDSIYARALEQPWGYKLLLAWALAEGPKVDEKFLSDVPTVIDVSQVNLPVLYMDMNKPMDYYVIRSIK